MKKIESFILIALSALFFYSLIELSFRSIGFLEESPTFIIPFRINILVTLMGLLISGLAGAFFPLWNVSKYLKTLNIKEIMNFKRGYRINYFILTIGFMGLACWEMSNKSLDVPWWIGLGLILLSLWLIVSPGFRDKVRKFFI